MVVRCGGGGSSDPLDPPPPGTGLDTMPQTFTTSGTETFICPVDTVRHTKAFECPVAEHWGTVKLAMLESHLGLLA